MEEDRIAGRERFGGELFSSGALFAVLLSVIAMPTFGGQPPVRYGLMWLDVGAGIFLFGCGMLLMRMKVVHCRIVLACSLVIGIAGASYVASIRTLGSRLPRVVENCRKVRESAKAALRAVRSGDFAPPGTPLPTSMRAMIREGWVRDADQGDVTPLTWLDLVGIWIRHRTGYGAPGELENGFEHLILDPDLVRCPFHE